MRQLTFSDMRLTRAMQEAGKRYATVDEYAQATGMTTEEIIRAVRPAVLDGDLRFETVGGQVFISTLPTEGRERRLPANLWEHLRRGHDLERSYTLWQLGRDLEEAGWEVVYDPPPARRGRRPSLSLRIAGEDAPMILFPDADRLAGAQSPLGDLPDADTCVITCRDRNLDATTTATRRWILNGGGNLRRVLILEEPAYDPVELSGDDGSLMPGSTSVSTSRNSWKD